ncbi:hypothetical protein DFH07DRAFT_753165, partial [Mycena maculata]
GVSTRMAAMDQRRIDALLARGADVRPRTYYGSTREAFTALHIALDTGSVYGRKGEVLDARRLEIASMLVEHRAEVRGVVDGIDLDEVLRFVGFEDLWDKLRVGVSDMGKKMV